MVGAVTAAAVGVASLGMGAYEMSQQAGAAGQANKVAQSQLGIQGQELGMQQTLFGEQQGYASQLQKLMADPSSVTSLPGYQFQFGQGTEAIKRAFGANPGGAEGAELEQYGQGLASSFYGTQAGLLSGLSGMTTPASSGASGVTGSGSNAVGAAGTALSGQNQSFNQMSSLLASLGYFGKNGFGGGGWGGASAGTPAAMGVPTNSFMGTDLGGNLFGSGGGTALPFNGGQ